MAMIAPLPPRNLPPHNIVTASDLVRHFGEWQERAARAPVYIMHRGRPRLVLTSVAVMDELCEPHDARDRALLEASFDAVLDASRDLLVIVDRQLRIAALSRTARAYFGPHAAPGSAMTALTRGAGDEFALDRLRHCLVTGEAETFEIISGVREGRIMSVAIEPHPQGALLMIRDVTDQRRATDLAAWQAALDAAVQDAGSIATARVNQRGYVEGGSQSLAALTGIAAEAMQSLRLVSLVEIGTRIAVGAALETVLTTGQPRSLDAMLLVARGEPIAVRIAFGAIRHGAVVEAALVIITPRPHRPSDRPTD